VTCILTVGAHAAFVPSSTLTKILAPEFKNCRFCRHFSPNDFAVWGRLSAEDWFSGPRLMNFAALRS
jgi:hypothetical protein